MPKTVSEKPLPTVIGFFVNATFVDESDERSCGGAVHSLGACVA
jgi:hypothetical protein